MTTWRLHRVETNTLWAEALNKLGKVLLVADIAWAGRVPEMYQADRAWTRKLIRQVQQLAVEQRGLLTEAAQVTCFVPPVGD